MKTIARHYNHDIHVIGAGPSGLASAIAAVSNRNADVLVSDAKDIPGKNVVCSGLFSNNIYKSMNKLGVDISKSKIWDIYGSTIRLPDGLTLRIQKQNPIASVHDRLVFDYLLYERAKQLGVSFEFNKRINSIQQNDAKTIIAADGPTSFISKIYGLPSIKKYILAGQFIEKYDSRVFDSKLVHLFIDTQIMPGFFGWLIPHNEHTAEYGFGIDLSYHINGMVAFRNFIKRYFPSMKDIFDKKDIHFALIPLSLRPKTYYLGVGNKSMNYNKSNNFPNLIVVGDAAGHTKATTGGGVVLNTQIGYLAGKYYDNPLLYELIWKKEFGIVFKIHAQINRIFHKQQSQINKLIHSLKEKGVEQFLIKYGDMDYPNKMLFDLNASKYVDFLRIFGPNLGHLLF